jgi:hypothetical protein
METKRLVLADHDIIGLGYWMASGWVDKIDRVGCTIFTTYVVQQAFFAVDFHLFVRRDRLLR